MSSGMRTAPNCCRRRTRNDKGEIGLQSHGEIVPDASELLGDKENLRVLRWKAEVLSERQIGERARARI